MLERNHLNIDPLLGPAFYEFNKQTGDIHTDIELPESANSLFFSNVLEKLEKWAIENSITSATNICKHLKETYIDNTVKDEEPKSLHTYFFKTSVPQLAGIVSLLENNNIPLDVRKDSVSHLFADIAICDGETHMKISNAYWKLSSHLDIATEWMAIRRIIAQQIVQNVLKKFNIPANMYTHYINAVLNSYSNMLGIYSVYDENVQYCKEQIMKKLLEQFEMQIPEKLTAETVIEHIIAELNLEKLPGKLRRNDSEAELLLLQLARYGQDKNFSIYNLIKKTETGLAQQLSWQADYLMYQTLYTRLAQCNFITSNKLQRSEKLGNGQVSISYLDSHSLKFATAQTDNAIMTPFIPYCVQELNPPKSQPALLEFITSEKLTDNQRMDIAQGILAYLTLDAEAILKLQDNDEKWLTDWTRVILQIMPNHYQFDELLKRAPIAIRNIYLKEIGWNKLPELVKNGNQLANLIAMLPDDKRINFLHQIGYKTTAEMISTEHQFATILQHLPDDEWGNLFDAIVECDKLFIRSGKQLTELPALIFSRLPENQWHGFFNRHFTSDWQQFITNMPTLIAVLNVLPLEKWPSFFQPFDQQKIREILEYQNYFLFSVFDWNHLISALNQLPKEKCALLLNFFGGTIKYNFSLKLFFPQFVSQLSNDKLELFMNFLGPELVEKIMGWEIYSLMEQQDINKCKFLYNYIGTESLRRITHDKFTVTTMLNNTSQEKSALFLSCLQLKTLDNVTEDKSYLFHLLNTIPLNKVNLVFNQFDKKQLLSLINNNPTDIFNNLTPGKISAIFDYFGKDMLPALFEIMYHVIIMTRSLQALNGIPEEYAKILYEKLGDKIAAPLIQNRAQLFTVFKFLTPDRQMEVLNLISDAKLKDMLLSGPGHNLDEALRFIDNMCENPVTHDAFLLALLRAYHEQYSQSKNSFISRLKLWGKSSNEEPDAFKVLTAAITRNIYRPSEGLDFYWQIANNPEKQPESPSPEGDELAKIAQSFTRRM